MQLNVTTHGELIKLIRKTKPNVQVYTSMGYVQVSRASILKALQKYNPTSQVFFNAAPTENDKMLISLK